MSNLSTFSYISAGSTNQDAQNVTTNNGSRLVSFEVFNTQASIRYLKIYNGINPTSAATPVRRILVPGGTAGAGVVHELGGGLICQNGISFRMTQGQADSDTTACAAGDLVCNIDFM